MSAALVLLGPQRLRPTLREAVQTLGQGGLVATITAGWEEREGEDQELDAHLDGRTVNLGLFPRAEQIFQRDPEVHQAFLERRERMGELAALHRPRLNAALEGARELLRSRAMDGADADLLDPEIEHAIGLVADLDRHHLDRVRQVDQRFEERAALASRESVLEQRAQVAELLASTQVLAIAGGHVGVLLNRLRLFDVLAAHGARPLVAWSAGAMALTERVVLFHDSPPQGRGDAEVYGPGLGLAPGLVALPHARHRLDLEDRARVELLARRFAPDTCVAMDEGARLDLTATGWQVGGQAQVLGGGER